MFGATKELVTQALNELRTLRRRVDEIAGRTDKPPMTKTDFYNLIDEAADTEKQKIGAPVVRRVLSVTLVALREMPERERMAMLQELIR